MGTDTDSKKHEAHEEIADARRDNAEVQTEGKDSDTSDVTRPKRHTASIARERIRQQLKNN